MRRLRRLGVQVVEPLARLGHFRQDAYQQPSLCQRLHMPIDRGAAGPTRDPPHLVVGPLQWVAQEPVQEPPIEISEGFGQLQQFLSRKLVCHARPHEHRFRHKRCRLLRLFVREAFLAHHPPGT